MVRKIILTLGIAAFSLTAAACNTVKGAGKDIQTGGKAITNEAQETQKSM